MSRVRDHLPPALIAFLLLGAVSTWSLFLVYSQDDRFRQDSRRQDTVIAQNLRGARYAQCVRGNEFRDVLDQTFRRVIAAAAVTQPSPQAKRALERRLARPLAELQASKRDCRRARRPLPIGPAP